MFIKFPVMGDSEVAVNSDRVTHVKRTMYAPYENSIICIGEKSIEVNMGLDEVIKRLNNADVVIMAKDDIQGEEQC